MGPAGVTVKLLPLLTCPFADTVTGPLLAPFGTVTLMLVSLQLEMAAVVPLTVTTPPPCVAPNPLPAIVTDWPGEPADRLKDVMLGRGMTANTMPLLT
jgi:hypothetical protein